MTEVVFDGTLAEALQSTSILPGSRILLRAGNYTVGDLQCRINNVTIMPYPGEEAVIIPASGYRCLLIGSVDNITLDGLIFDGTNVTNEAIKITGSASNITIQNCEVKNAGRHGILVSGTSSNITISACHVHHNGTTGLDHCVYLAGGDNLTVTGCEINNAVGMGVHAYGGEAGQVYTIEKNYIHDCPDRGIGAYYGVATIRNNVLRVADTGMSLKFGLVAANIYHNTMTGCSGTGALLADELSSPCTIDIRNNLFDSNYRCISLLDANASATLRNNLYSRSTLEDEDFQVDVDTLGNISQSCLPVTDSGEQFIPTTGSPAIDAGIVIASVTDDYAGTARANPPTIGAYEPA